MCTVTAALPAAALDGETSEIDGEFEVSPGGVNDFVTADDRVGLPPQPQQNPTNGTRKIQRIATLLS
jgi:hypothetical protein